MTQSNTIDLLVLLIRMSIDGEKIMKSRQTKDDKNKLFNIINCFPLRKNISPKYIDIDTAIIKQNLLTDKNLKLSNEIWEKYFRTNKKIFKKKGYNFNRRIVTDGVGCTILFIRSDLYDPFKKSNVRHLKKPKNYKSDHYIDELSEEQLKKLRGKKLIGIDPGKSDLIFCTDGHTETIKKNNGKIYRKTRTFKYSNGQRKMETKSKIYSNKLENDKKETIINDKTVKEYEAILSGYNSSSCIFENVKMYIQVKNFINYLLLNYYEKELYRKFKWYSYINKQKSEAKMVNNFGKKFGSPKNTVILMGDFSQRHQMKFCEPTKGKSIRKLFKDKGYQLNLVQEYNTSKCLYETGEELVNFKWDKKRGKYVHRLLGSKILKSQDSKYVNTASPFIKELIENGYRSTIINRDLNGSLNIRYRGWHVINGLEIPEYFKYKRNVDNKMPKIEKEIIIAINNLPQTSKQIKVVKRRKVTKTSKIKVTKKKCTV